MGVQVVEQPCVQQAENIEAFLRIDQGSLELAEDVLVQIFLDALSCAGGDDLGDDAWGDEHGELLPGFIMDQYTAFCQSKTPNGIGIIENPDEMASHMERITSMVLGSMKVRELAIRECEG